MAAPEVRLERLRPAEITAALERAPVAWIPLGALEYHADHLPNGTDGITGHGLLLAAAERLGGVVLPWSYLTMGTLALPWSFRYDPAVVAEALRQTLRQLPAHGVRLAVVHTGHGPLDLNHLIKRVCAEVEAGGPRPARDRAVLLGAQCRPGHGARDGLACRVDHGSTMETSWVSALEPGLVATARLQDDVSAPIVGVYGPNPRFTVDATRGSAQIAAAADLLARRVAATLRGESHDPFADLRTFVERYWPERLILAGRAGRPGDGVGGPAIVVTNPAPVSRYLSGLEVQLDGVRLASGGISLVNATPGETGIPITAADLGPDRGFSVRRLQTAEVRLAGPVAPGSHAVDLVLNLAGVTDATFAETVDFT